MRVALAHDWLTGMRGGEKVLEGLGEIFPDADLFTLLHVPGSVSAVIERRRVHTSFIQRLPFARTRYRWYLLLFPAAVEQFDLDRFDLVLSTSHCAAKSVITAGRARHISYCHSPMRYAWDQFESYFGATRVGPLASRWVYRPALARLARWDAATAHRVNRFIANSRYVAARIRRYYNRQATIVHPPCDTVFYQPGAVAPEDHFLIVSALVPYKRIELAIEACRRVGARLRIAGDGPDRAMLERHTGSHVEFLGWLQPDMLRAEYHRAAAVILPGEEDFGIVPVEAQACGRPVVALGRGGALETVIDDDTGVLVPEPTVDAFVEGLERLGRTRFDVARLRANAERFSRARHLAHMRVVIDETVAAPADQRW